MLNQNRIIATTDAEETRCFLAGKNLAARPGRSDSRAAYHAVINGLYAPAFYIAFMRYGAELAIDAPAERTDYGFSVPLRGDMASSADREMVACSAEMTVLASPGTPQTLVLDEGSERLSLSLQQDAVRRRLTALTGEPVTGVVRFEPGLDLTTGPGRLVRDAMELVAREQDRGLDVFASPLRVAHFEEITVNALLLYQPHSHTWMLERPAGSAAPRDVRRAIDYIEANHDAPVGLEDLVAVAGVPGRTLRAHFHDFTGLSPMAYLRTARLRRVRETLLSGDAATVTEAATRHGFLHMGRFSRAYGEAFGEPPSATLLAARRRS